MRCREDQRAEPLGLRVGSLVERVLTDHVRDGQEEQLSLDVTCVCRPTLVREGTPHRPDRRRERRARPGLLLHPVELSHRAALPSKASYVVHLFGLCSAENLSWIGGGDLNPSRAPLPADAVHARSNPFLRIGTGLLADLSARRRAIACARADKSCCAVMPSRR